MNADIRPRVEALVANLLGEHKKLDTPSGLLGAAGGFDSTKTLELIITVEREFGIVINDDEIKPENLGSTESLIRFISLKKSA